MPPGLPPWVSGAISALIMAAIAWGGIGARVVNLEAASTRIEAKVDQILLQRGSK